MSEVIKVNPSDGARYFDNTAVKQQVTQAPVNTRRHTDKPAMAFVDPATDEKLVIGQPPVKEEDIPQKRGTGLAPATTTQLTDLVAKFAK